MCVKVLIQAKDVDYEVPGVDKVGKYVWKGKADIVNHEDKLVVDLKLQLIFNKFNGQLSKYNYDSQAYIYRKLFGYDMVFIVIDKTTHQIGVFDCSPEFYRQVKTRSIEQKKLMSCSIKPRILIQNNIS